MSSRGDRFRDEQDQVHLDDAEALSKSNQGVEETWAPVPKPYKTEIVRKQINEFEPGEGRRVAIISTLRDLGVKVFIIEAKSIESITDILHHVYRVIDYVSNENQLHPVGAVDANGEPHDPLGFQRCLLYQDRSGRLFNLVIAPQAIGPLSSYEHLLSSFSGLLALIATTVLCRSLPCAVRIADLSSLKPAALSLVLGLVFTDEVSLAYTFAQMFVLSMPSLSAHTLTSFVDTDVPRKVMLFLLAISGFAKSTQSKALINLAGIVLAISLFLSNLGSRSWRFMGWKPLPYRGPLSGPIAFLVSIVMGMVFPFMGHRKVHVGGKAAYEHLIFTGIIVAIVFQLSQFSTVQQYVVMGTDICNQDYVNVAVGAWFIFGFLSSLFMITTFPSLDLTTPSFFNEPESEEPLLKRDETSPVGYRVPSLPNFEVDPTLAYKGVVPTCSKNVQILFGIFLAALLGGGIIWIGLSHKDDSFWKL